MTTKYVFPGITKFVRAAAANAPADQRRNPVSEGAQVGQALGTWHIKRLADALAQLPAMLPKDRPGKIDHIVEVFGSLELAYNAAKLAINEVLNETGDERPASLKFGNGTPGFQTGHKKGK